MQARRMLRSLLISALLCTLIACGPEVVEAEPEPAEVESTDQAAVEAPAEVAPAAEATAAPGFDGAWVVNTHTGRTAWLIEGDKLTTIGAGAEVTFGFSVVDDCTIALAEEGSTTYTKYAWDGETLYVGPGNAGVVRADGTARACVSNVAFEWKDGACERHKKSMWDDGKWETEAAECSFAEGVFEAKGSRLEVVGAALLSGQMKGNKAERHGSFAEAMTALR